MRQLVVAFGLGVLMGLSHDASADNSLDLEALVATSGEGADGLLAPDGGWVPPTDPRGEGVLLRFPAHTPQIDAVRLSACDGSGRYLVSGFVDGRQLFDGYALEAGAQLVWDIEGGFRSLFVRLDGAERGSPRCLARVEFLADGQTLSVDAPRRVEGRVRASSTLEPADAYHVSYLFDDRTDFGWVEGADGDGVGETIGIELAAPTEISGFLLWNGYQRSADHFEKNSRLTEMTVRLDGGEPQTIQVQDSQGAQRLMLERPQTATRIELGIGAAARGSRYRDLVLSELRLIDRMGTLSVQTSDRQERIQRRQEAAGVLAAGLDRQLSNVCGEEYDEGERIRARLRADGSFVWYCDEWDAGTSVERSEVMDGAWIIERASDAEVGIRIFGRRHRVEQSWDPYASGGPSASEGIVGGRISLRPVASMSAEDFAAWRNSWIRGPMSPSLSCMAGEEAEALRSRLSEGGAWIFDGSPLSGVLWSR